MIDEIKKMIREELNEADRDYKAEYKKFQSSKKMKKYRAELNAYNRKKGTYGNGDKKDASHRGGKIVGFEAESKNRGRAEKSRLKKEGKLTETTVRLSRMKDANFEPGRFVQILGKKGKVKLDKKSVSALVKLIRSGQTNTGMGRSFTTFESKINEAKTYTLPNGIKVKIEFKGITLKSNRSKPVFLDRSEMMTFFKATSRYLKETRESKVNEDWNSLQPFSSKEAKSILDRSVRDYAKILRKAQYQVVKDWMSKAKAGVLDYYDIVRGLKTGDISRAHPYETEFLHKVLSKDKIVDRFRKYFGGKKSMNQRLVKKHKRK